MDPGGVDAGGASRVRRSLALVPYENGKGYQMQLADTG